MQPRHIADTGPFVSIAWSSLLRKPGQVHRGLLSLPTGCSPEGEDYVHSLLHSGLPRPPSLQASFFSLEFYVSFSSHFHFSIIMVNHRSDTRSYLRSEAVCSNRKFPCSSPRPTHPASSSPSFPPYHTTYFCTSFPPYRPLLLLRCIFLFLWSTFPPGTGGGTSYTAQFPRLEERHER